MLPAKQHGEAIRLCGDYRLTKRHGIHIKIAQLLVRGWIDGHFAPSLDHCDRGLVSESAVNRQDARLKARQSKRIGILDQIRIGKRRGKSPAKTSLLIERNHPIAIIRPHDCHKCGTQTLRRFQLLRIHQEPTVAGHCHYLAIGVYQLRGNRARHGNTHRGQTIRHNQTIGTCRWEQRRQPEFVDADIGNQDILIIEGLSQLGHHPLGSKWKRLVRAVLRQQIEGIASMETIEPPRCLPLTARFQGPQTLSNFTHHFQGRQVI